MTHYILAFSVTYLLGLGLLAVTAMVAALFIDVRNEFNNPFKGE